MEFSLLSLADINKRCDIDKNLFIQRGNCRYKFSNNLPAENIKREKKRKMEMLTLKYQDVRRTAAGR